MLFSTLIIRKPVNFIMILLFIYFLLKLINFLVKHTLKPLFLLFGIILGTQTLRPLISSYKLILNSSISKKIWVTTWRESCHFTFPRFISKLFSVMLIFKLRKYVILYLILIFTIIYFVLVTQILEWPRVLKLQNFKARVWGNASIFLVFSKLGNLLSW